MVNHYAKLFGEKMVIMFCKLKNNKYFCTPKNDITYKQKEIMTKADIVNEVAKATGMEKIAAQNVVEAFMESVKNSLAKDEDVFLRGFGSFITKKRAQKTARNISQGKTIVIPEHYIPAFKPAKVFMNKVKSNVKVK